MKQTDLENTSGSSIWTTWKTEWPSLAKLVLESLRLVLQPRTGLLLLRRLGIQRAGTVTFSQPPQSCCFLLSKLVQYDSYLLCGQFPYQTMRSSHPGNVHSWRIYKSSQSSWEVAKILFYLFFCMLPSSAHQTVGSSSANISFSGAMMYPQGLRQCLTCSNAQQTL